MIITEIQHFSSEIIRFQATFKGTVEFTCALEFKISSQLLKSLSHQFGLVALLPRGLTVNSVVKVCTNPLTIEF